MHPQYMFLWRNKKTKWKPPLSEDKFLNKNLIVISQLPQYIHWKSCQGGPADNNFRIIFLISP